ncbi:MAG: ATP-binding protein, partial [Caldilineaceae bacterium]
CIQSLSAAASLYRGDFLAGFSLPDAPEFETWQLLQRESLHRELSGVLDQLANVYAAAGRRQYDLAIAYARRWLALDVLNEAAHRTLMRLYAESGDRGAAVHQYEECERALREELSVEPDDETNELMARIRSGELDREGGYREKQIGLGRQGSAKAKATHNLPAQATTFIGRGKELGQISERLADVDCRLLTIVGPGGSGKTRLAIEAAAVNGGRYRDGVRFVDLSAVETADLLATAIERGLEMVDLSSADPRRRLCEYLRPKQMLLVLDNLEHLLEGVDLLPEMLHGAPELTLLVTSRERLNVREEWLLPLDGLSYPRGLIGEIEQGERLEACDLEGYEAAELFVNRMRKLRPNYVPDRMEGIEGKDARAIGTICRLLEGMPLAIELAAGWTRTLTLAQLEREIEESLDVLSGTFRDVPARLRSMRAAFDHSWGMLTGRERDIMRQMSVFRGGCTLEAAGEVTGAGARDLAGLVDKSWLRMREGGRYTVHELARQYCEEKLKGAQEDATADPDLTPEAVRRRHCAYYGTYLNGLIGSINHQTATLDDILLEFGNLLAALQTSLETLDIETAYDIVMAVFFIGDMLGRLNYSLQTLGTTADKLEYMLANQSLVEPDRTGVARILGGIRHAQYNQYRQLGMLGAAAEFLQQLQALLETMPPGRARYYWNSWKRMDQANLAHQKGDYESSRRMGQRTLALFDPIQHICYLYSWERGVAFWLSEACFGLAYACWAQGDYAAAEENFARCMEIRDASGERRWKGMHLAYYALLAGTLGQYARAEELAREGLHLSQSCGDRLGAAGGHLAVGRALSAQGRFRSARRELFTCLETGRQTGRIDLVMRSLSELARIDLAQGRPSEARHRFEDSLASLEGIGETHNNALAGVWLGLGWTALAEADDLNRDEEDSKRSLLEARRMFEKARDQRGVTAFEVQESRAGLAFVLLREGAIEQATMQLEEVVNHPTTATSTRHLARTTLATMKAALADR